MINVAILVLKNSVLASIADARRIFIETNKILAQSGIEQAFNVELVGEWESVQVNDGLFKIFPDVATTADYKADLIIIPAMTGDMITATFLNKAYGAWIDKQYRDGAEVASLCVGAFLLAFTGLLKNKECTTHWAYADEFRSYYPAVKLVEEKMFTGQSGLYSSGGNNSYWNLLLFLIEKFTNRQIAIEASKFFLIDIDRIAQSPFLVFRGTRKHEDETVLAIQEYIEQNFSERMSVIELASRFNLTRRTLERRFAKVTHHTVAQYIQRVKLEAAKKMLEIGRNSIANVMLEVGYTDVQTFRENFKEFTNMTPIEYRNKFCK